MKASELRIGNLVNYGNAVKQLDAELFLQLLKYTTPFEPITLTEEWLLKFGFERKPWGLIKGGLLFRDNIKNPCSELTLEVGNGFRVTVQYLHQLQNLYFALTGEELTFKSE